MKRKLSATIVTILMMVSAMAIHVGGAELTITTPEPGDILNTKVVNVTGIATPGMDYWKVNSKSAYDAGSYDNITLTEDNHLIVDPYIDDFARSASNPIIDTGANWSYNEMGTALGTVIKDGTSFKMWTIGTNSSGNLTLGYSTSADGKTWNTQNGTLVLGGAGAFDEVQILPGTVIKEGSTYKMWYSGMDSNGFYGIGYATSSDGITWTKGNGGDPVMEPGPINKFDGGGVAGPSVIKDGATYKMWYCGLIAYSGYLWQIGYATSADGVTWTKQNHGDAVLSFGKSTAFDKDGLALPSVVKDGPTYRVWYIGIPSTAIGYATSSDGVDWERAYGGAPAFGLGKEGEFDEKGFTNIQVFRDGNDYYLYYSGLDAVNTERIGLATSQIEGLNGKYESDLFNAGIDVTWAEVTYEDNVPEGTTSAFFTRVSDNRVDWTPWLPLDNGNSAYDDGFYIQFKVTMSSPDGIALPTFWNITVQYYSIERVEVSTDNSTWILANGAEEWWAIMHLKEGANTIYIRTFDTIGIPIYTSVDVMVDTIKPTGVLLVDGDAQYTKDLTVDLTLATIDASGVDQMMFSTDENMTGAAWIPFANTHTLTLPEGEGLVTVYCKVMDTTGLVSNPITDSIILDMTAPNGTVSIRGDAPMTTFHTVTLSLKATDKNGVSQMRMANNASFSGSEWKTFSATAEWELEGADGTKVVYVEYKDYAGNTEVFSDDIILDTVKPTGSIKINDGDEITTDRRVTVTLSAQDANSVSHVMLSNEPDFLDSIWAAYETSMLWTMPENIGQRTVYAKFKDTAGLVSNVVTDTIILDIHEEGFEGSVVVNDGDDYANDQTLTLTLDLIGDDGECMVMVSDNAGFTGAIWEKYNYTMTFTTAATDGKVTIYAVFKDKYGVQTEVATDTIIIDTEAPTVTITAPTEGKKVKKANVEITGSSSDNMGVAKVEVQLPNGQWIPVADPINITFTLNLVDTGEHTINVRATDHAGNMDTASVNIKYVKEKTSDTTPGFEAAALVFGLILVALFLSRRRVPRV